MKKNIEEVTMKKVYAVLTVVFFLALCTTVFAFGPESGFMGKGDYGSHRGGGRAFAAYMDLSKDQIDQLAQLKQKYRTDTEGLRSDLLQKRTELKMIYADPSATDAAILAKQKEVDVLKQKLQDKMTQLKLEERKIFTTEQLTKLNKAFQNLKSKRDRMKNFSKRGFKTGAWGKM